MTEIILAFCQFADAPKIAWCMVSFDCLWNGRLLGMGSSYCRMSPRGRSGRERPPQVRVDGRPAVFTWKKLPCYEMWVESSGALLNVVISFRVPYNTGHALDYPNNSDLKVDSCSMSHAIQNRAHCSLVRLCCHMLFDASRYVLHTNCKHK
jgi:hypothetical protein